MIEPDPDYFDPPIVTNYDGGESFYKRWILPPKDQMDSVSSIPKEVQDQISPAGYTNGEDSKYSKRGYFLIFNHEQFRGAYSNASRKGTEHDVNKLKKIMDEVGFTVRVYENKKRKEIRTIIKKYSNADMRDHEMFGLSVLTHGEDDGLLMAYDGPMYVSDLVDPIKTNLTLLGKPKLFFIQACRGSSHMDGWKIEDRRTEIDGIDDAASSENIAVPPEHLALSKEGKSRWPLDADILMHYAQSEGYTSTRNPYVGSSFIISLCYFMKFVYQHEFHDLLIRVNAMVALRETHTGNPLTDGKKQIPQIQSQLTKLLFFKPMDGGNEKLEDIEYTNDNVEVVNGVPMMVCQHQ